MAVIGILLVLVALLLPTANRAREQARLASCASNLRQIGTARQAWHVARESSSGNDVRRVLPVIAWRNELTPYGDAKGEIFYCPVRNEGEAAGNAKGVDVAPGGEAGGTPATPGGSAREDPFDPAKPKFFVKVKGGTLNIPLTPGPYVKKMNPKGNSYEYWVEDWPNGDWDYNDLRIRVTEEPDGRVTLQPFAGDSGATHDLTDDEGNVLIERVNKKDVYQKNPTYTYPEEPPAPPRGSDTEGSDGSSGTGLEADVVHGQGESDYAMNRRSGRSGSRGDLVVALDYTTTIVADAEKDLDLWRTPRTTVPPRFARHFKRANVLFGDGSVRLTAPAEIDIQDPARVKAHWQP